MACARFRTDPGRRTGPHGRRTGSRAAHNRNRAPRTRHRNPGPCSSAGPRPRSARCPGARRFKKDAARRLGIPEPEGSAEERAAIARNIASTRHKVRIDGRHEEHTLAELLLIKLRNLASQGDTRAAREYNKYLTKFAPQTVGGAGFLVVPGEMSPEEWARATEDHNRKADARRAEELKRKWENGSHSP